MTKRSDQERRDGTDTGSDGKAGTREFKKETLFNLQRTDGSDVEDCSKAGRELEVKIPPRPKR